MRARHLFFPILCSLLLCSLLLVPASLGAGQLVLEFPSGADSIKVCDRPHSIGTCEVFHIDSPPTLTAGATLQLSGRSYVLVWAGVGYYLESGLILQPLGEAKSGLGGQRWLEVYPNEGRIHTSRSWQDTDGNRSLSRSDTLALDADRAQTIKDVRLQLRVEPAAQQP